MVAQLSRVVNETKDIQARATLEVEQAKMYGTKKILTNLLPTIDNLDRALANSGCQNSSEASSQLQEGVSLTRAGLVKLLKDNGVTPIEDGVGSTFDPSRHEAMLRMDASTTSPRLPNNSIGAVLVTGWMHHERVLRPSKVSVVFESSTSSKENADVLSNAAMEDLSTESASSSEKCEAKQ